MVVACLSPAAGCARESASTLAFAQRARRVVNAAVVNEARSGDAALLAAEVERLRRELRLATDACASLRQACAPLFCKPVLAVLCKSVSLIANRKEHEMHSPFTLAQEVVLQRLARP